MAISLLRLLSGAAAGLWLLACASPGSAQVETPEQVIASWRTPGAHPLVGRIWIARDNSMVDGAALSRAPAGAGPPSRTPVVDALGLGPGLVLLGEIHDNAAQHRLRAGMIRDLAAPAPPGAVPRRGGTVIVSEHIRADQAPALAAIQEGRRTGATPTVDDLFRVLQWDKSGWPDARIFRPLYDAALATAGPILAGDVPRERIRAVARGGLAALPAEEVQRLGLERPLPPPLAEVLAVELRGSHCGMLPESAIPGMALAQRYRDAHLAAAMIEPLRQDRLATIVLLAGNGHVRTDRGVPWHLRAMSASRIVAVMLIEVADGRDDPAAYIPRDPDGRPAADAVVFTPRAVREDPCERMRARMPPPKPKHTE